MILAPGYSALRKGTEPLGNPAVLRFLNRDYTDSGIRNMWAQIKFVF
jgi:hypothetical protein